MSIEIIEDSCARYAAARDTVRDHHKRMMDDIEKVRRQYRPGLLLAIDHWQTARAELLADIEANEDVFTKPRTRTFSGVKVGITKQKGKVEIPDTEKTVTLIMKRFDKAERCVYLKAKVSIVKDALRELSVADAKAIGITITNDTDKIMIKDVDTELDKLLQSLADEQDEWGEVA